MKAIYAVHKQGGRFLLGIKPNSFDLTAWSQQRTDSNVQSDFTSLVEEPMLDSLSVDELVEMANDLIAILRKRTDEPVVVKYSEDVTIEVRPADDDDRVLVSAKGRGDTVVNYQTDGLVVDVYAEEELGSLSSDWFDNADLTALEEGSSDVRASVSLR